MDYEKVKKALAGVFTVMLVLAFFACDNGNIGHTHTWDWTETTAATCETVGTEIETCSVCDEASGESREVAKLPHAWEWVEATVWGMETGECGGCAETEGLRLAPEMMVNISGGTFTLGNDNSSFASSPAVGEEQARRPVDSVSWYGGYTAEVKTNPMNDSPGSLSMRVRRGGSWADHEQTTRSDRRGRSLPYDRSDNNGIRLVLP